MEDENIRDPMKIIGMCDYLTDSNYIVHHFHVNYISFRFDRAKYRITDKATVQNLKITTINSSKNYGTKLNLLKIRKESRV